MGETISFSCGDTTAAGYLATPASGSGPGLVVLQEWWGLVPQIRRTCDRLAAEGFTALAPDLYRGEVAQHDEMDKAGHLMSTMPMERAAADMSCSIDHLLSLGSVTSDKVGVIGFCMGGMLTLVLAAQEGDRVAAAVPFYGAPLGDGGPDWSNLTAIVRGHMSDDDGFFPKDAMAALETELQAMGKDVRFEFHPAGHAFANEENPIGSWNEAEATKAWSATLEFLHETLG